VDSLSLIIPAHNAGKFIESSLIEYYRYFSKFYKKFEIIVVCNACSDDTYKISLGLKNRFPSLVVLNIPKRGKGNAVVVGLDMAKYDIIGFLDADNPYNLLEIIKMIALLEKSDMVIVTKFKRALKYQTSLTRRFFSIAGALFFRFLFGMSFKDTQAGGKFMKKKLWRSIKRPFICEGFEFDMELLYKASKLNFEIIEFYINPNYSDFSTVKMRILPGMVYRLFKMRILQ